MTPHGLRHTANNELRRVANGEVVRAISEVMSLDDAEAALRRAAQPGVLKVLLAR